MEVLHPPVKSAAGSGRMGCLPPTDRFRPKTDYRDSGKQTLNVEITGLRGLPRGPVDCRVMHRPKLGRQPVTEIAP